MELTEIEIKTIKNRQVGVGVRVGLPIADYETMLEPSLLQTKIIPFPGVTLDTPDDDFQTQLDGFLREIGYIE